MYFVNISLPGWLFYGPSSERLKCGIPSYLLGVCEVAHILFGCRHARPTHRTLWAEPCDYVAREYVMRLLTPAGYFVATRLPQARMGHIRRSFFCHYLPRNPEPPCLQYVCVHPTRASDQLRGSAQTTRGRFSFPIGSAGPWSGACAGEPDSRSRDPSSQALTAPLFSPPS